MWEVTVICTRCNFQFVEFEVIDRHACSKSFNLFLSQAARISDTKVSKIHMARLFKGTLKPIKDNSYLGERTLTSDARR